MSLRNLFVLFLIYFIKPVIACPLVVDHPCSMTGERILRLDCLSCIEESWLTGLSYHDRAGKNLAKVALYSVYSP
ncbi:uncharacterized protein BDV17DRAFT_262192 [Aspergillus undulatus]|uniref:uncharacterized protein n=1 Tax=Aspergillus undulatus TaxID=1810928 RepID=UPI003CCD348C